MSIKVKLNDLYLIVATCLWSYINSLFVLIVLIRIKNICQGHRDGTLLFAGTVISQKLSHRQMFNIL